MMMASITTTREGRDTRGGKWRQARQATPDQGRTHTHTHPNSSPTLTSISGCQQHPAPHKSCADAPPVFTRPCKVGLGAEVHLSSSMGLNE